MSLVEFKVMDLQSWTKLLGHICTSDKRFYDKQSNKRMHDKRFDKRDLAGKVHKVKEGLYRKGTYRWNFFWENSFQFLKINFYDV